MEHGRGVDSLLASQMETEETAVSKPNATRIS